LRGMSQKRRIPLGGRRLRVGEEKNRCTRLEKYHRSIKKRSEKHRGKVEEG